MNSDIALIEEVKRLCKFGDYSTAIDLTYACNDPLLGIKLHILCTCSGNLDNYIKG